MRGQMFISKLQLQYQRSATENALMTFQLDCPELLKLTGVPGRLIAALFEHSSVVERMKSPAGKTYPGESKSPHADSNNQQPGMNTRCGRCDDCGWNVVAKHKK